MSMGAHPQAPQLERRAVGLPTAISTVFGLIVATTVLVSVGQGRLTIHDWESLSDLGDFRTDYLHVKGSKAA